MLSEINARTIEGQARRLAARKRRHKTIFRRLRITRNCPIGADVHGSTVLPVKCVWWLWYQPDTAREDNKDRQCRPKQHARSLPPCRPRWTSRHRSLLAAHPRSERRSSRSRCVRSYRRRLRNIRKTGRRHHSLPGLRGNRGRFGIWNERYSSPSSGRKSPSVSSALPPSSLPRFE